MNNKYTKFRGGVLDESLFSEIISLENLHLSWRELKKGKTKKADIKAFAKNVEENILLLHQELKNKTYTHSAYHSFYIQDPKLRHIHKATVKDRVLHHAIFRILYPFFDKTFIFDSYSCRLGKGTHRAMNRLRDFARKVGKNNSQTCWILKCDIKKFFDSIHQDILLQLVKKKVQDADTLWLMGSIINSFSVGIPMGNITSQLFCNIYMNEFDQFVKHTLKAKYYIRYCDDFLLVSEDKEKLHAAIPIISLFLQEKLQLSLHPNKIIIKTLASGVDFLGWTHFPNYRVLRNATQKRMFRKLHDGFNEPALQSYLGLISHGNSYKIREKLAKIHATKKTRCKNS